jgi:hypothetical protein
VRRIRKFDVVSIGLVGGFFAALAFGLVEVDRVFGLPAHVLLVHAPIVLVPLMVIATLVVLMRPTWRRRFGVGLAAAALVVFASVMAAKAAGDPLEHHERARIQAEFGSSEVGRAQLDRIEEHAEAGDQLAATSAGFTFVLVSIVVVDRQLRRRGIPFVDSGRFVVMTGVVAAVLALGTLGAVVRAGHLGSKAAWEDKVIAEEVLTTNSAGR